MSLKVFHVVFVAASSLLSFAFSGWCFHAWRTRADASFGLLAALAALLGVGLIVYGFWFWRKITTREEERRMRRKNIHSAFVPFAAALWLADASPALACGVCYGEAQGPMIDAARLGVWLLFGLVLLMQLGFGGFFLYLWRRARRHGGLS